MSSPSPPKPQKINPYQGMDSDPRFADAAKALGINNPNNPDEIRRINAYMFEQDRDYYQKDPAFILAQSQLAQEGRLSQGDYRYHDYDSYKSWAKKEGYSSREIRDFDKKMQKRTGDDWYQSEGGSTISERDITAIQSRMDENKYAAESADQQEQLRQQYLQMRADQKEDAESQRKMMEEMMNQPVYMPQQQATPVVQAPRQEQEALLPAPTPNTPMSISAPPAPELTNAGNRMAIVRTPKSTQARSRRATRGTSSLIN